MDILMKLIKKSASFAFKLKKVFPCYYHEVRRNIILRATTQEINEVVVIERIKPVDGQQIVIAWGDKTTTTITEDTSNLEHTYAIPKEYKVQVDIFLNLEILSVTEEEWSLDSRDLVNCTNLKGLKVYNPNGGYFNTSNLEDMSMTILELKDLGNSFRTIIRSEDFSNWNLVNFIVESIGNNEDNLVIFNSLDVSSWSPDTFVLLPDNVETDGEFNSSDISSWNPFWFRISNMDGEFNSSDMSLWTHLDIFNMYGMKETLTGSFSLGETVFASTDVFVLRDMPINYEIVIPSNSLRNWIMASYVNVINNNFIEEEVDNILLEFYTGYSNKTEYGGEIYITGFEPNENENSEPSGTFEASASPTTGKEYAYELLNDTEDINPDHEWDVVNIISAGQILTIVKVITGTPNNRIFYDIQAVAGTTFKLSWGDGETVTVDETGLPSAYHEYELAGEYNISISNSLKLRVLDLGGGRSVIDTRNLAACNNLQFFSTYMTLSNQYFNTYDFKDMNMIYFSVYVVNSDTGTVIAKSEDMTNWNPSGFRFSFFPIQNENHTIIFDSSDISSWNPTEFTFRHLDDTVQNLGTFNSSDIASWNNIGYFMLEGLYGEFNSSDMLSWTEMYRFDMANMKQTATGTFDFIDVPYYNMLYFSLKNKSSLYKIYIFPLSIMRWYQVSSFSILNNNLTESQVDSILQEFYVGYPNRYTSGGTIDIRLLETSENENALPSGTFQASADPTTGKEYAYELLNDSENINPGKQWEEVNIGALPLPDALLYITTTEIDQYTEIAWITPITGESLTIYWGDGTNDVVTVETFSLVHYYATPDTYEVTIDDLVNLKQFAPSWMWVFDSSYLDVCVNLTDLNIIYTEAGIFDSYDLRNSPLVYFEMGWMGANFTTIIRSEDMYNWNIDSLRLNELGTNENSLIVMNSSDISSWSPSIFQLEGLNMTAISGTFDSSDIALWSPTRFMISNVSGQFNSSDIDSWTSIEEFRMYDMQSDATGSFNFINVYPTIREFVLYKSSLYGITVSSNTLRNWSTSTLVDLSNNAFSQSEVDTILQEFFIGYTSKTPPGGSMALLGNAAPSGIYQAANPPTTGKEYAYELEFDSEGLNPGNTWETVSIETS